MRTSRRARCGWSGRPASRSQVARDLGVNEGTLGNWVNADRRRRGERDGALSEDERAELARLRRENAELAMRCDVLKRSVALWVSDAMGR
jgi:transposase